MASTEYFAISEPPEDKWPKKKPYFKHQRGVQYIDVSSDSEDELPRSFSTAKENWAPRRDAVVMYALIQFSVMFLQPDTMF